MKLDCSAVRIRPHLISGLVRNTGRLAEQVTDIAARQPDSDPFPICRGRRIAYWPKRYDQGIGLQVEGCSRTAVDCTANRTTDQCIARPRDGSALRTHRNERNT